MSAMSRTSSFGAITPQLNILISTMQLSPQAVERNLSENLFLTIIGSSNPNMFACYLFFNTVALFIDCFWLIQLQMVIEI